MLELAEIEAAARTIKDHIVAKIGRASCRERVSVVV